MWTGILGQTAESLGKLNNVLSMTGMLVEHVSNHAKLLLVKAQELYLFTMVCKRYIHQNKSEILAQLGIEIDSNPYRSLEERQKELVFRRIRSGSTMILTCLVLSVLIRKLRKVPKFEAAFKDALRYLTLSFFHFFYESSEILHGSR